MLVEKLFSRYAPTGDLPRWASDILTAVPARGGGLNRWLLRAAIALRRCERTDQEIHAILKAATGDQAVKPGEIERAVERSHEFMADNRVSTPSRSQWSAVDVTLRSRIIEQLGGIEVADLCESSPYRLVDDGPYADDLVDLLFPDDPLLCCASDMWRAHTAPRSWWRGRMSGLQFIVPSPMTAQTGRTQDGKTSARCLGNTGPRWYLVVEQDSGTPDEQAAILLHLAERAPLALALTSGNKSLHGWFSCKGAQPSRSSELSSTMPSNAAQIRQHGRDASLCACQRGGETTANVKPCCF